MKNRLSTAFILLALSSFLITSCTKETTTPPSITLDQTYKILNVGSIDTLGISIDPPNVPITSFTMSSSDTSVATVNARGIISAKAPGNTTITAESADGSIATCQVTVAKWTYYNSKNSGLTFDYIDDLTVDSQNNIWCVSHVTVKGGLAEFNGTKWTYYYPPNSDLHGNKVKTDKNGNVWAASFGNGVYNFDGTTWTDYKPNSYLSPDITSI